MENFTTQLLRLQSTTLLAIPIIKLFKKSVKSRTDIFTMDEAWLKMFTDKILRVFHCLNFLSINLEKKMKHCAAFCRLYKYVFHSYLWNTTNLFRSIMQCKQQPPTMIRRCTKQTISAPFGNPISAVHFLWQNLDLVSPPRPFLSGAKGQQKQWGSGVKWDPLFACLALERMLVL